MNKLWEHILEIHCIYNKKIHGNQQEMGKIDVKKAKNFTEKLKMRPKQKERPTWFSKKNQLRKFSLVPINLHMNTLQSQCSWY